MRENNVYIRMDENRENAVIKLNFSIFSRNLAIRFQRMYKTGRFGKNILDTTMKAA
jgi:hypothetical protein